MNESVIQLIEILSLEHSERWINLVWILETTGSVEKHDSIFIIMSQKNSKQSLPIYSTQSIRHS